jgi:hypothetical protein
VDGKCKDAGSGDAATDVGSGTVSTLESSPAGSSVKHTTRHFFVIGAFIGLVALPASTSPASAAAAASSSSDGLMGLQVFVDCWRQIPFASLLT